MIITTTFAPASLLIYLPAKYLGIKNSRYGGSPIICGQSRGSDQSCK